MNGLERVFSKGHQYFDRVFCDSREGQYYDRATDLYLTQEEAHTFRVR